MLLAYYVFRRAPRFILALFVSGLAFQSFKTA